MSIVYDGDGNRVAKTVTGVTTTYLVDTLNPTGYAQVIGESFSPASANGKVSHNYVYGLALLSQTRKYNVSGNGTTQQIFYDYDGHGSVRALTNTSGAVTDTYDYDAFGNLIHSTGSTPNNYLFAGEQFDPDLGLYYNRARYLNVQTGRFWTMDIFEGDLSSPTSLHRYLFVDADPINLTDKSGEQVDALVGEEVGETLDAAEVPTPGEIEAAEDTAEVVEAVAETQVSQSELTYIVLGLAVTLKGDNTDSNKVPRTKENQQYHAGRLQVQGPDIGGTKGPSKQALQLRDSSLTVEGDTVSFAWSRKTPLPAETALQKLENLELAMSPRQTACRTQAFDKAEKYILRAASAGGVSVPPPVSKTFTDSSTRSSCTGDERVDIEVKAGTAFVP